MHTLYPVKLPLRRRQRALLLLFIGMLLLMGACGGDAQVRQRVTGSQARLDQQIKHAQQIGVPASLLQPLLEQEQQIRSTGAPFDLFSDQPINDYYQSLDRHYAQLSVQVQRIIVTSTERAQAQSKQDLHTFQLTLQQKHSTGLSIADFSQQYNQSQTLLSTAHYPKDYAVISHKVHTSLQAVSLLEDIAAQMARLKDTMNLLQDADLDITALQMGYQQDEQTFSLTSTPVAAQQLAKKVDAQNQQAVTDLMQAIPAVTVSKLKELDQQIQLLKAYNSDLAVSFISKLVADSMLADSIVGFQDYQYFANQVDIDIATIKAGNLIEKFHREVNAWGNSHLYYDSYNGRAYPLDAGYMLQGIGSDLDRTLMQAKNLQDFRAANDAVNNALFTFHAMEANYKDPTAYNQLHATDVQMLAHYQLQKGQVLVVSLTEQTMRIYQGGKLVRALLVTTGRPELPSLPGNWSVLSRQSPTLFKSGQPRSSPYWYPDTPIHYALLYHDGGYFVHDSWWRASYGPGTQFPHADATGNQSFAGDGSHGCINVQEGQAAWIYNNTDWNTTLLIY